MYVHTFLLPSQGLNFCSCFLPILPISFIALRKISDDSEVPFNASHLSHPSKQNFSKNYLLYNLSIHVFTSYSLFMLFKLDLILSTPFKIPLHNTVLLYSIGTRFPWGPPYLLVIPSSSFPNGSFSFAPPLNVGVLPGPALDHFIFFIYIFSQSDVI